MVYSTVEYGSNVLVEAFTRIPLNYSDSTEFNDEINAFTRILLNLMTRVTL